MILSQEVRQALQKLNDVICEYERDCGRQYMLILISLADRETYIALNGRPIQNSMEEVMEFLRHIEEAKP